MRLYRRHRTKCEGGHAEDSRTGEFEEGRRGWKKCACLIQASGTLGGVFARRQTGKPDWDEAKAAAVQWEVAGSWTGRPKVLTPAPAKLWVELRRDESVTPTERMMWVRRSSRRATDNISGLAYSRATAR